MEGTMRRFSLLIAVLSVFPAQANSQLLGIELAGGLAGPGVTVAGGEASLRTTEGEAVVSAALFASDQMAIEPSITGLYRSDSGIRIGWLLMEIGFPVYFKPTRGRSGLYVRPVAGARLITGTRLDTDVGASAGIGFGGKIPLQDDLALRLEAVTRRHFPGSDTPASTRITGVIGLSLFLR
jgi:hypothetical protein